MSKSSELAVDALFDLREMEIGAIVLKTQFEDFIKKYGAVTISNDPPPSQLEETPGCRLNISNGIVSFIEMRGKQCIVQFG